MELQRDIQALQNAGINLATISYDSPETLKRFADAFGITFPMLSDVGSTVIKRFDLLNPVPEWGLEDGLDDPALQETFRTFVSVTQPNEMFVGIAFPGTFILDSDGVVDERHFENFYIERNTVSSVLIRRGAGIEPVEATRVSTAQINMTSYSSNQEIAVGNRFSLVVDIEPLEDMHVYAPGADDYQIVNLRLDPNPYIRTLPVKYPASVMYYFEPFDENIPVYLDPFTLVQEVILDGERETQQALADQDSITLTGSLDYQACDDAICYLPTSIPVSWTMQLRGLVFRLPGQ
ncbi:MAG: redoxin domain-containing protein [Gammaproteobacteria bacterium]|nr:redoxin domain-containing protein [Gammaproteobacteria bacterium]